MQTDPVRLLSENPDDFCFIDTETRALPTANAVQGNVKTAGAHLYARHSKVIIVSYAIGNAPVQLWTLDGDLSKTLSWRDTPADLRAFLDRVHAGKAWFVAWNAAFDRLALNHGVVSLRGSRPNIPVTGIIDAMAQAACAGLPAALAGAAKQTGLTQKVDEGKGLIGLFCTAGGATPDTAPDEWQRFLGYARDDVGAMRDVWNTTRQLPAAEWEVYWANEEINDRGLPMDRALLDAAAQMAATYEGWARGEVSRITGEDWGPKHHVALAGWAFDRLQHIPEAFDIIAKAYDEVEDSEGVPALEVSKISLDRPRLEKLVPLLEARDERMGLTDDEFAALELCEVKTYASGSTVQKFGKALQMLGADDRLRGQYVFNGGAQTGRFSSRGVQTHNLTRAWVGMEQKNPDAEEDAIVHLLDAERQQDGTFGIAALDTFTEAFGPAGRTLSRLIRPAITALKGSTILWGDYSNIEARVLPWLSGSEEAESTLDIFRNGDRDPSAPDIYMIEAAKTYHKAPDQIDKGERQIGKVQVLSLGFGGGAGALMAMAANYRLALTREEAQPLVTGWRANNPWATSFWADVWRAAMLAFRAPGTAHAAGRLTFFFDPDAMGGTLFMLLPSQRLLSYPRLKHRMVTKTRPNGEEYEEEALTYYSGGMRKTLWYGILVENATQAAAADLLRASIVRINEQDEMLIGHTHDELIAMVPADTVEEDGEWMRQQMVTLPDWAVGLPVAADVEHNDWYSKVER